MKFILATLAWVMIMFVLGLAIWLVAAKGIFWVLGLAVVALIVAVGKIGCAAH